MEETYILERLGKEDIPTVISKPIFSCGRSKESDLICLSLLVSRHHCSFTRLPDGLYIIDLGSSNGVCINQEKIRQKVPHLLKENDIIGVGCGSDANPSDEGIFIYRLKKSKSNVEVDTSSDKDIACVNTMKQKKQDIIITLDDDDDDYDNHIPINNKRQNIVLNKNSIQTKNKEETLETIDNEQQNNTVSSTNSSSPIPKASQNKNDDCQIIDISMDDSVPNGITVKEEPNIIMSIKEELQWGYSQNDISEIDDENNFPASQLFDKTHVKQENDMEEDYHLRSLLYGDEDEVITILDSDNENEEECNDLIGIINNNEPQEEMFHLHDIGTKNTVNPVSDISESTSTVEKNYFDLNKILEKNGIRNDVVPTVVIERTDKTNKNIAESSKPRIKKIEIIEPHHIKVKNKVPVDVDEKNEKEKKSSSKHISNKDKKSSKNDKEKSVKKKNESEKNSDNEKEKSKKRKSSHEDESHSKHKKKKTSHSTDTNLLKENFIQNQRNDSKNKNDKEQNKKATDSSKTSISSKSKDISKTKHRMTDVKVKVSKKTRNDILCDAMQAVPQNTKSRKDLNSETKKSQVSSESNSASTSLSHTLPINLPSYIIPRLHRTSPYAESKISQKIRAPHEKQLNEIPSTSNYFNNHSDMIRRRPLSPRLYESPPSHDNCDQLDEPMDSEIISDSSNNVLVAHPKSSLIKTNNSNGSNKKVCFNENIASVKEYAVESGNKLRKISAGISTKSINSYSLLKMKGAEPKLEDFLSKIFPWEPIWLEQQQQFKKTPPIVKENDLKKLPTLFESYNDYYKSMEVLLLLETWQSMMKEFECSGRTYLKSEKMPCQLINGSIKHVNKGSSKYTMMNINVLTTKSKIRKEVQPNFGDLIILEYNIKQDGIVKSRKSFAYVISAQQHSPTNFLKINVTNKLCEHVTNPDVLITYGIETRVIDESTLVRDQIFRLRSILYLRPFLRLIQGLQYLPRSPLSESILSVDIDDYKLNELQQNEMINYQLVTKEKLNEKQLESVIKFTNAAVRMEPKICLLMGPPGTGKSKVISNLVTQILYGDGRYVSGKPLRILVCAPSNAAVDEIVLRLLDIRSAIKEHRFKMVRIGQVESMHEEVKKISLSELSRQDAMKQNHERQRACTEANEQKKHKLKSDIEALESLVSSNPTNCTYKKDLEEAKRQYESIAKKSLEQDEAEMAKLQASARDRVIKHANIIACTLSSCYNGQMEKIFGGNDEKISACIVDEATQSCEAETLIPLMLGIKTLILVGDPNQLPATVMSTEAKKLGLDKSLFTRLKEGLQPQVESDYKNNPLMLLNMQYRMVSSISYWPNKFFYNGKLEDKVNSIKSFPLHPYRVLNLDSNQDNQKFSNTQEAQFVGNLINCIMTSAKFGRGDTKIRIGIITPYQHQKALILEKIQDCCSSVPENNKKKFVTEVNTIDSFQGQERDIIIMSCVRSNGIGFLSDPQRLCVALTRAKLSLIICGNFNTFQKDTTWNALLSDARSRGLLIRVNSLAKPLEIKHHIIRT